MKCGDLGAEINSHIIGICTENSSDSVLPGSESLWNKGLYLPSGVTKTDKKLTTSVNNSGIGNETNFLVYQFKYVAIQVDIGGSTFRNCSSNYFF